MRQRMPMSRVFWATPRRRSWAVSASIPFGTVLLPGLLLFAHSPFLFGYAKPVPVNFRALRNPRMGMVLVAAAGPAMNIALAIAAALSFHLVAYLPPTA